MLGSFLRLASCCLAFACVALSARMAGNRLRFIISSRRALSIDDILRDEILSFLLFAAASVVASFATSMFLMPFLLALAVLLSKKAPKMLDRRAQKELRSNCDEQADVMADIVAMGVRSGLSFDAALGMYCAKFDNELAQEISRAQLQWTSGLASREQALSDFAARINSKAIKRFSDTSLQAIKHGSPLADMLEAYSKDIRRRRKAAVERQVEKAPVKMLVPTGVCILPAMLILVMGPVILQFMQSSY